MLDRRTGELTGSPNMAETSTTASMIKAWVVADQLRRTDRAGERPSDSELHDLSLIIRESNNELTHELWDTLGGTDSITRLIRTCELTDSSASDDTFWSRTRLSARDTARLGGCIADGTAAGPKWTKWLLKEMRQVHGLGDFGIREAFPAAQRAGIAIKNGWVERTERDGEDEIHVNCLAVADELDHGRDAALPQGPRLRVRHGGLREDHRSPAGRLSSTSGLRRCSDGSGSRTAATAQPAKNCGPSAGSAGASPISAARRANSRSPATCRSPEREVQRPEVVRQRRRVEGLPAGGRLGDLVQLRPGRGPASAGTPRAPP